MRKLVLLSVALVTVIVLLLMGIDATVRASIEHFDQAKLFADLESNRDQTSQQLESLVRDSVAMLLQQASTASRRVPTLEDLRSVAKTRGLRISRLERKAASETKANDHAVYVISVSGNVRNAIDALHSFECNYLCSIDRLALQPSSPSGDVVTLSIQIQVQP